MKYQDILSYVLVGKFVRHSKNRDWVMMDENGNWINEHRKSVSMSRTLLNLDTWEVKPEIPKEIYFWASSRSRAISKWANYVSLTPQEEIGSLNGTYKEISCTESPWFDTGIPQKYKLIPVDEEKFPSPVKSQFVGDVNSLRGGVLEVNNEAIKLIKLVKESLIERSKKNVIADNGRPTLDNIARLQLAIETLS